jgi:hypothetical protein
LVGLAGPHRQYNVATPTCSQFTTDFCKLLELLLQSLRRVFISTNFGSEFLGWNLDCVYARYAKVGVGGLAKEFVVPNYNFV